MDILELNKTKIRLNKEEAETLWEAKFSMAEAYFKKHNNLIVSNDSIIFNWLKTQRSLYKKGLLTYEQIDKLKGIGMIWKSLDALWDFNYALAEEYYKEQNNLLIPLNHYLGSWIRELRKFYKKNELEIDKIALLESIGMIWDPNTISNEQYFEFAKLYYEKNGNLLVPSSTEYLGKWIIEKRRLYKDKQLSLEEIKKLEEIGMVWSISVLKINFDSLTKLNEEIVLLNDKPTFEENSILKK